MPNQDTPHQTDDEPQSKLPVETAHNSLTEEEEPSATAKKNSNDGRNKAVQLEQDIRSGERWLIGIGIATVVVNTIIALIYYDQLHLMRTSTEKAAIAADAARDAADEARRNRLQAEKGFLATVEQFRRDQRAWVGIAGSGHFNMEISEGGPLTISVDAQNFGKTPALQLVMVSKMLLVGTHERGRRRLPNFSYSKADAIAAGPTVLFPGSVTSIETNTRKPTELGHDLSRLTAVQVAAIRNGIVPVYVYGSIWYDDPLTSGHRTDYCFIFDSASSTASRTNFITCKTHNNAY